VGIECAAAESRSSVKGGSDRRSSSWNASRVGRGPVRWYDRLFRRQLLARPRADRHRHSAAALDRLPGHARSQHPDQPGSSGLS